MYDRNALIALVRQKALKFGEFMLASGKKASYYLDGKQVTLDPDGAPLVAEGILDLLKTEGMPQAVGGMSIGADPITAAVVTLSAARGTPLRGFMVRKQAKGHGQSVHKTTSISIYSAHTNHKNSPLFRLTPCEQTPGVRRDKKNVTQIFLYQLSVGNIGT